MGGIFINTNIMAIDTQINLGKANDALQVSLKRLASGLRINSAADDASGLAISEKMRAQISGLHRATLNAQDGISLLQTAEGALKEVHGILQRMRELAVQAANGTLTATDRVEIQKEIQQLKAEIDRISTATEFNTKKLLNGDAAALWSTDAPNKVEAIIRDVVMEGNFKLQVSATPGQNQVMKTDIFTLREGAIGIGLVTTSYTNEIKDLADPVAVPAGKYKLDLYSAGASLPDGSASAVAKYAQSGSGWTDVVAVKGESASKTAYIAVRVVGFASSNTSHVASAGVSVEYKIITMSGGESDWIAATVNSDGVVTAVIDAAGVVVDFNSTSNLTNITLNEGDTLLVQATTSAAFTEGGVRVTDTAGTSLLSPIWDVKNISTGSTDVYFVTLDTETGNLNVGTFKVDWQDSITEIGSDPTDPLFEIVGGGGVATSTTRLRDISKFYDPDGNFILSTPQKLTVWNGPNSYDIYLDADDTIGEVAQKIRDAIVKGLGLGTDAPAEVQRHIAEYISIPGKNESAVKGTIVIRSPMVGEAGEITISGDENLIKALSIEVIQEAVNPQTTVEVRNAHTNDYIGEDTVSDGVLRGIIKGVDVKISPEVGINVEWDSNNDSFKFVSADKETFYLHVVDYSINFHIGANQNQVMSTVIGRMDTVALGVDNLLVVDAKHAEAAISKVDRAIQIVSSERGKIGAIINRLQKTISNLNIQRENMMASESRIRDLDMAAETSEFTKYQILSQTAMAMLAQANTIPQQVLQLLR